MSDDESEIEVARTRGEKRSYPRKVLSDALRVAQAIRDNNAGKPFSPQQIADALGKKPRSSDFQSLLSASQAYGLTEGNVKATSVNLTALGREIVYPTDRKREYGTRIAAFLHVEIFKRVFDHFEGSKLPEARFLRNNLISSFQVPEVYVDEFIRIYEGNLRFIGVSDTGILEEKYREDEGEAERVSSNETGIISGRRRAFVIMPFTERNQNRSEGFFREVYHSLIEPAVKQAGFQVEWANKAGSDVIQSTIINEVLDADILIADLTDHNPNVLFELGLRMAYNKGPTALIKTKDKGRLFDVDNLIRVYEYSSTLWRSALDFDIPNLEQHVRATWDNKDKNEKYLDVLRRKTV